MKSWLMEIRQFECRHFLLNLPSDALTVNTNGVKVLTCAQSEAQEGKVTCLGHKPTWLQSISLCQGS
jgi:hypothetical protein